MNQPNQPQGQQVQVKLPDDVLKGVYSNNMQVMHTKEEFVLDFMNIFPPQGIVSARVLVSPQHFKRMVAAVNDNLKKYEDQFGKIAESQQMEGGIGFRTE